jgi:hypothetical protein
LNQTLGETSLLLGSHISADDVHNIRRLQGEDKPRVAVYISNSSAAERLAEWLRWYNITAEVVEGLDDPVNFLR